MVRNYLEETHEITHFMNMQCTLLLSKQSLIHKQS